jgi:hypothetical protein
MSTVGERCQALWTGITTKPTRLPSHVSIPPENVDTFITPITPFQARNDYFRVVINEMYLTTAHQWASVYDPMVLAITEFAYDGEVQTVPVVVGPSLLGKGIETPEGMLYANTRVAGLHPFAGASFVSTIILYQVERKNYIRELLQVVERAVSVLDFAKVLATYIQLADVVLEGVQALVGFKETQPLLGVRTEFGGALRLVPSYLALVDLPNIDPAELAVRETSLYDLKSNEPFRRADYVLCSIEQVAKRDDEMMLPFFKPLWNRVVEDASAADANSWKSAKANMLALAQAILLSPDFTDSQKLVLIEKYKKTMKRYHGLGQDTMKLGPDQATVLDDVRAQTIGILDLE